MAAGASTIVAPVALGAVVASRYRITRELGSGTFGWVYEAAALDDLGPAKKAALKILRPEHASETGAARFVRRELELLKRIHFSGKVPNVVKSLEPEIVTHEGLMVMVLELVEGPSLTDVMTAERVMDQGEVRAVLTALAAGVAAIHEAGGIHRDLKPDNIRLRATGEPVILDLGIAKALWNTQQLTSDSAPMTPLYAAPEQLVGEEVGQATDIYALGLIGYEMLAGAVPLAGRSLAETTRARDEGDPPDVRAMGRNVSQDLASSISKCLARSPRLRPTASALGAMLAAPLEATSATDPAARLALAATEAAPQPKPHRGSLWLAGVGIAGVAGTLMLIVARTPNASQEAGSHATHSSVSLDEPSASPDPTTVPTSSATAPTPPVQASATSRASLSASAIVERPVAKPSGKPARVDSSGLIRDINELGPNP